VRTQGSIFTLQSAIEVLAEPKGDHAELARSLGSLATLAAAGVAPVGLGIIALTEPLEGTFRLGERLLQAAKDRTTSAKTRGYRALAAHTVVQWAAFTDALTDELHNYRRKLTPADRAAAEAVKEKADAKLIFPSLTRSVADGDYRSSITAFYKELADATAGFLLGREWVKQLDELGRHNLKVALGRIPSTAESYLQGYELELCTVSPAFTAWYLSRRLDALTSELRGWNMIQFQEHGEEREVLPATLADDLSKAVPPALHGMRPAADRPGLLDRLMSKYARILDEPVVGREAFGSDLTFPPIREGYISPGYLAAKLLRRPGQPAGHRAEPWNDAWWQNGGYRCTDLLTGVLARITEPDADRSPILVLGDPGSGKSLLTRVLAANLATEGVHVIRVELRHVEVDSSLTEQVRAQLDRDIPLDEASTLSVFDWGERDGQGTLVLLLDGFDELVQASRRPLGDYLERLATFQNDQRSSGRSIVILVTSRMLAIERVAIPPSSLVIRLEPFSTSNIETWVEIWRETTGMPRAAIDRLVAAHPDLARQPLLLSILCLFATEGQEANLPSEATRGVAYSTIVEYFVRRELLNYHASDDRRNLGLQMELELNRLQVAALGMVNRRAQWLGVDEYRSDLRALLPKGSGLTVPTSARSVVDDAELMFGRFFFVYRAQSRVGRTAELYTSYEFLHSTFGEFFHAQWVVDHLSWILAELPTDGESFDSGDVADNLLRSRQAGRLAAGLAFGLLTEREATLGFYSDLMTPIAARHGLAKVLDAIVWLEASAEAGKWRLPDGYQFGEMESLPAQLGRLSCNLALLILAVFRASSDAFQNAVPPLSAPLRLLFTPARVRYWFYALSSGEWKSFVRELLATHAALPGFLSEVAFSSTGDKAPSLEGFERALINAAIMEDDDVVPVLLYLLKLTTNAASTDSAAYGHDHPSLGKYVSTNVATLEGMLELAVMGVSAGRAERGFLLERITGSSSGGPTYSPMDPRVAERSVLLFSNAARGLAPLRARPALQPFVTGASYLGCPVGTYAEALFGRVASAVESELGSVINDPPSDRSFIGMSVLDRARILCIASRLPPLRCDRLLEKYGMAVPQRSLDYVELVRVGRRHAVELIGAAGRQQWSEEMAQWATSALDEVPQEFCSSLGVADAAYVALVLPPAQRVGLVAALREFGVAALRNITDEDSIWRAVVELMLPSRFSSVPLVDAAQEAVRTFYWSRLERLDLLFSNR
jgi:hypothetical protein